jgi:hypothetical protein
MAVIVEGRANEAFIENEFGFYSDDWKSDSIRDAVRLLTGHFGGRGTWYSLPMKPIFVLGFLFNPSIIQAEKAISLDEFNSAIREFVRALELD